MHGRSVPSAGRELFDEFAGALAGWEWDVALLQEVPPWWPAPLAARRRRAAPRAHLAQRTAADPACDRRRWPDLIKSNGGGPTRSSPEVTRPEHGSAVCGRPTPLGTRGPTSGGRHLGGEPPPAEAPSATPAAQPRRMQLGGRGPDRARRRFRLRQLTLDGFKYAGGPGVDSCSSAAYSRTGPGDRGARPGTAVRPHARGGHARRRARSRTSGEAERRAAVERGLGVVLDPQLDSRARSGPAIARRPSAPYRSPRKRRLR